MNEAKKALLLKFIEYYYIVQSWGVEKISHTEDELCFYVSGFKYVGMVKILCKPNKYIITFQESATVFLCGRSKEVIYVLDNYIEYSDDYIDKLRNWIAKQL